MKTFFEANDYKVMATPFEPEDFNIPETVKIVDLFSHDTERNDYASYFEIWSTDPDDAIAVIKGFLKNGWFLLEDNDPSNVSIDILKHYFSDFICDTLRFSVIMPPPEKIKEEDGMLYMIREVH